MAGLGDYLETVMGSPLFLGGAALASGEGFGGAMKGMAAGNQFREEARKRQQEEQLRTFAQQLASDPKSGIHPNLAQLFTVAPQYAAQYLIKHPEMELERERTRAAVEQARAATAASLGAESRAAALHPVQLEAERRKADPAYNYNARASAAAGYGLKPGTREFNEFVLTGDFPKGRETMDTVADRVKAAEAQGLKPGTPAFQHYTLTGKMPKEDQMPLTATDKKAILEADEMVMNTEGVLKSLDEAKALSKRAYSGPTASARGYGASLFGSEAGRATEELNNVIIGNALQQLKATFGAAPTEGERKILLEIQGAVNKDPAVREAIFERARLAAERRLKFYQERAAQMRGGEYFKGAKPDKDQSRLPAPGSDLKSKYGLE